MDYSVNDRVEIVSQFTQLGQSRLELLNRLLDRVRSEDESDLETAEEFAAAPTRRDVPEEK